VSSKRPSRPTRVEAAFRVRYKTLDDLVVGYSKNLSKGGLFLRTDRFLPMDARVRLHIELPDGGGEITVECRVVYVRDETDWGSVGQPPGMGIQFLDPNDEARGRIEKFIAEFGMRGAHAAETAPRKTSIRVLVVDDDATYCKLAAEPFRERGDTVAIARDGIEALAQCIRERPDVVLCDVQMPKMDGWQLLRMVRARPALAEVPFVFLTTLTSEEDRLLGYRLGVDDYIEKPYRPLEVVARADRAISRAARRRESGAGTPSDKSSLRGDVEQVSLGSVLSFLEMEKKTGVLEVEGLYQARLFVRDGSLLRVEREVLEHGSATSDREAVFELLDWRRGTFEFQAGKVAGEDRLRSNITSLLLEHARVRDEAARDA
jgi:uncharacterized protein (TIGR02266 family)